MSNENDKDAVGDDDKQPKLKVIFAEGCFDDFDGTQEELDALIAQLQGLADSGELLENSIAIEDFEDVDEEVLELLPMLTTGNTRH